jgi:hypothetical protein
MHTVFTGPPEKVVESNRPVQQTVLGMDMQMNKLGCCDCHGIDLGALLMLLLGIQAALFELGQGG